jgi:ferredoxin
MAAFEALLPGLAFRRRSLMIPKGVRKPDAGTLWVKGPVYVKGATEMARRVVLEKEECLGCETCVEICAEVFSWNEEEEKAEVTQPEGGAEDCIEDAIASCPAECIHWEDED